MTAPTGTAVWGRTTRVRCDECLTSHHITVTVAAARRPSESRWDYLLVLQLRGLGWSAGIEPSAHHTRSPRDICPNCVAA